MEGKVAKRKVRGRKRKTKIKEKEKRSVIVVWEETRRKVDREQREDMV